MQPLADTLRRAPLPLGEAVALAAALAEALAREHRGSDNPPRAQPGTVLVGKSADGSVAIEFRSTGGKPTKSDERAAVQELGVICYRLLTGKPPIKGNVALIRDLDAAVSPGSTGGPPDALKSLVLELISVDPARRPPLDSAAERLTAIAREVGPANGASPGRTTIPGPAPGPQPDPDARSERSTAPPPLPPPPKIRPKPGLPPPRAGSPRPTFAKPATEERPAEASSELVPDAPILPATPVVVAATATNKSKKSTDTQERLFFAEGDRMAETMQAEAAAAAIEPMYGDGQLGDQTELDVERTTWWTRRRVVIAGAAGAFALVVILYAALSGDDEKKDSEPLAAAEPADTAKVAAAAPEETAPATPEPAAEPPPEPEPVAEPPPEPEPVAEPPPEPEPEEPKKSSSSSKRKSSSSSSARKETKPEPAPAKTTPAKTTPSDPMSQARAARARGKASDAYRYYSQAAKGKDAAAATLGMAEMAYSMKRYGDAISHAKKAKTLGANEKKTWRIIAESHCKRGEGRSAWFAFAKAGGGDCKK
jgi:hypothetical protein